MVSSVTRVATAASHASPAVSPTPLRDPTELPDPNAIHNVDRSGENSEVALRSWMAANATRMMLPAKSVNLAAIVAGTPRRENGVIANAVLLVPGFPESADTFAHQIRAAAKAGLYVIAVNPPGFPGSDIPAKTSDLGPAAAADEICVMLQRHGIQRALCLGHDWGASVVSRMVTQPHTQKCVAALALLNNGWSTSFLNAIFTDEKQRRASGYMASLAAPDGLAFVQKNNFELIRNCFDHTAGKGAYTATERDKGVACLRDPKTLNAMLQWYRNLLLIPGLNDALLATNATELAAARAKYDAFLASTPPPQPARFDGPAGQILGANDPYTKAVASRVPPNIVPRMQTQVLQTTSHFSHREEPAIVNAMVLRLAREAGLLPTAKKD